MDTEEFALNILRGTGFKAERIEVGDEETPDYLVDDGASKYLIELKTKQSNPEVLRERNRTLQSGEVYGETVPLIRRNRYSALIRKGSSQLCLDIGEPVFRLIWLHAGGHNPDVQFELFQSTLYGSTTVVDFFDGNPAYTCYYFYNSDFYNYRDILDGAILSTRYKAKLCLNDLSGNYEALKNSALCRRFAPGICDPVELVREGEAYIVDADINRKDKKAVLEFLREKCQRPQLRDMTMNHMSGTLLVPDE